MTYMTLAVVGMLNTMTMDCFKGWPVQALAQKNLPKTATLKKIKIGFQDQLSLNAGQKYCRMLQREHSAILWTFIKLPVVIDLCFVYF